MKDLWPSHVLALVALCISGWEPLEHCYSNNLWPSHVFNCTLQLCCILLWIFSRNSIWDSAAVFFCAHAATLSDVLCINSSAACLSLLFLLIACLFKYTFFSCAGCSGNLSCAEVNCTVRWGGYFKINAVLSSRICPIHFSTQSVKRHSGVCFASLQIQREKNQKQDSKQTISLEIGTASELKEESSLMQLSCCFRNDLHISCACAFICQSVLAELTSIGKKRSPDTCETTSFVFFF